MSSPPEPDERTETDLHVLRLILRDVVYILLTETQLSGADRNALVGHLDALNEIIGDDDAVQEPDRA